MLSISKTALSAGAAFTLCLTIAGQPAFAEKIVANCTGMVNFDIYTIDTTLPEQEIDKIGMSNVAIDESAIVLTGAFGEIRFDMKVGTLYENGSDTGVYCTYSRKE